MTLIFVPAVARTRHAGFHAELISCQMKHRILAAPEASRQRRSISESPECFESFSRFGRTAGVLRVTLPAAGQLSRPRMTCCCVECCVCSPAEYCVDEPIKRIPLRWISHRHASGSFDLIDPYQLAAFSQWSIGVPVSFDNVGSSAQALTRVDQMNTVIPPLIDRESRCSTVTSVEDKSRID